MVESLLATVPEDLAFEILFVDDGSTDGTRGWLARLGSPFRVLLNDRNRGYAVSNNRGAAAAKGEVLAFLNNDLVLTAGWLEPLLSAHQKLGPRAGLVGNVQFDVRSGLMDHSGIFINHKGKPEHLKRDPADFLRWVFPLRPATAVTGACFVIERYLWNSLGGFDERFQNGCEDVDLCLRATAAGRTNAVALRSRIRHHISSTPGRKAHDEANTRKLTLKWREELAALALPDWCRHHFETFLPEPRDFPDPDLARRIFLYLAGLHPLPPKDALPRVRSSIEIELRRWETMFDPARADAGEAPPGCASAPVGRETI